MMKLEGKCGRTYDCFEDFLSAFLKISLENLARCDPVLLKESRPQSKRLIRVTEIIGIRMLNIFYHIPLVWRFSPLRQEGYKGYQELCDFIEKMVPQDLEAEKRHFLPNMFHLNKNKSEIFKDRTSICNETILMFAASSETGAMTTSATLLILGMFPEIQEKLFQEQKSILGDRTEPTFDDIKEMDYLERVIKEVLRLFPSIPMILRTLREDIAFETFTLPKSTGAFVLINSVHRNPELWPDPLKFDPDRFLPEEVKKRHRCAYMPFSFGPRNCIGFQYGMLLMKTFLSMMIRRFKVVQAVDYENIEDIEMVFSVVAKIKGGYRIVLQKRD